MTGPEFVTVAQLRAEMASVLSNLGHAGAPVYLTQRGRPRAVLLDLADYRALIEQLEYLDDSLEALLARDRLAAGEETRPLEQVIDRLRRRTKVGKAAKRSRAPLPR